MPSLQGTVPKGSPGCSSELPCPRPRQRDGSAGCLGPPDRAREERGEGGRGARTPSSWARSVPEYSTAQAGPPVAPAAPARGLAAPTLRGQTLPGTERAPAATPPGETEGRGRGLSDSSAGAQGADGILPWAPTEPLVNVSPSTRCSARGVGNAESRASSPSQGPQRGRATGEQTGCLHLS